MADQVGWHPQAYDELHAIAEYISVDSESYARSLVTRIVDAIFLTSDASGEVINFDDLNAGIYLTGTNYAGLIWKQGNLGSSDLPGEWHTPTLLDYPRSEPRNINNAQGSTLMGIGFPSPVNMHGAYFAVQGGPGSAWATAVRVHGYFGANIVGTTPWLTPLTTEPAWYDMSA